MWAWSEEATRVARNVGNVTEKLRRYIARRATVDCSSLNATITSLCSQNSVANVELPQGLCLISSQIVIPDGCEVHVSGTGETVLSGSYLTRHFLVPQSSLLNVVSLTLVNGSADNGVRAILA